MKPREAEGADGSGRWFRIAWLLLGGAWGAWIGFGGYFGLKNNPDSFGSMLALAFFGAFGGLGLLVGAAVGAGVGGLVNAMARRIGVGSVASALLATAVSGAALWALGSEVQRQFPGLQPH
jgi:hypothetical protein